MIANSDSNSHNPIHRALKKLIQVLPSGAPRKIYHTALKVPIARDVLGNIVRSTIPEKVATNGITLYLDREDIAVSGSLALAGFESYETDLFKQALKPGMKVLDVGAHIGYYSLLAAKAVGPTGRVISFEPEPRNNALLTKNVAANNFKNVMIVDVAASDTVGTHDFYLEKYNKGHHSFGKGSPTAEKITVTTDSIDNVLKRAGDPVIDVMKIDIEGAEPIAFRGMQDTIARSPNLTIFAEIYPSAITRLGGNALTFLEQLTSYGFKLWVINEEKQIVEPIRNLAAFTASIPGGENFKNIIAAKE
ncbi:MAG TPA: FkbM family methyltransferase [Candidatus Paceibacterota bacterium]